MKLVIVLAAVFGLANSQATCSAASPNLYDEMKKFADMIPVSQIEQVALNYIVSDEQVQEVLELLQADDFAKIVNIVNGQSEMIDLYAFLCKNGVKIYQYLNTINDLLGLPHVTPAPSRRFSPSSRTFRQFLDDIEKLIPFDKLEALFKQEETDSAIFKEFADKVSSKEFRAMVDKLIALPEVKTFKAKLEKLGADFTKLEKFVKNLLGWTD